MPLDDELFPDEPSPERAPPVAPVALDVPAPPPPISPPAPLPPPTTSCLVEEVLLNIPADGHGVYEVQLGELKQTVEADSPNDAWAHFCDAIKQWPSPKRIDRKIRRVR